MCFSKQVKTLLRDLTKRVPAEKVAVHFHDTFGQALSNISVAMEIGVRTVDSSVAGLGGCPYAKGASGNVATEDVVFMLRGNGVETGVDLGKLAKVGDFISGFVGRKNMSKAGLALLSKC